MRSSFSTSSIDSAEVAKFSAQAYDWWNPTGNFRPLHKMNPARIQFLKSNLANEAKDIRGLRILDVGCGAGILSESLARLGGNVIGVDASKEAIEAGIEHASNSGVYGDANRFGGSLLYRCSSAEDILKNGEEFDLVVSMEVLEHVLNPLEFLKVCTELVRPGGGICLSTINKTTKSYLLTVLAAEKILKMVPEGTHDWEKFLDPLYVTDSLRMNGLQVKSVSGLIFSPISGEWSLASSHRDVNYILYATKAN
jgi:2-polyprenyl-6-hydroxyphenyl methylase/3-demethylubiquinone-9 3-methyltransferase